MSDNIHHLDTLKPEQIQSTTEIPDFISRIDISRMTDPQLDKLLNGIQKRRMSSFVIYERTEKDKIRVTQERAKLRLDKKCDQIIRKLNTLDKGYGQLEVMIQQIRGLRLEAGLEII